MNLNLWLCRQRIPDGAEPFVDALSPTDPLAAIPWSPVSPRRDLR
jgi:hypothetical protein